MGMRRTLSPVALHTLPWTLAWPAVSQLCVLTAALAVIFDIGLLFSSLEQEGCTVSCHNLAASTIWFGLTRGCCRPGRQTNNKAAHPCLRGRPGM